MLRPVSAFAAVAAVLLACMPSATAQRATSPNRVIAIVRLADGPATRVLANAAASSASDALAVDADSTDLDRRRARSTSLLMTRLQAATRPQRDRLAAIVRQAAGRVIYSLPSSNAIVAEVSPADIAMLRAQPDVVEVTVDEPRRALIEMAGQALLVPAFWAGGFRGGAVDVAVIDTGLYSGHVAFSSRLPAILNGVFHETARQMGNYADYPDDPDDFAGHGTAVAGVIFSQGDAVFPGRRGMAPGLDKLFNIKAGYFTNPGGSSMLSDLMAGVDWSLQQADPPEVFNYSYGALAGYGSKPVDDDAYTRFWDGVVDSFGKTVAIAAGNSGDSGMNTPGIAYNVLSVASIDHHSSEPRADDSVAVYSSRGPTPGNRKKPDVAAPGTSLWLPALYGPNMWSLKSGTSFASPAVAGVAALLIDSGVGDPRAVKALLINSADHAPATVGWDPGWGWGYVNAERAYAQRGSVLLTTVDPASATSRVRLFERPSGEPTKATAVWNRHVAYQVGGWPTPGEELRNLDLFLYGRDSGLQRSASVSTIDNVEQVADSSWEPMVLAVVAATPFAAGAETVALAHSGGFVARTGPGVSVTLGSVPIAIPGTTFTVNAVVGNPGDLRGHDYAATLSLPPGYTLEQGPFTLRLASLDPGEQAKVSWTVRAPGTSQGPAGIDVLAQASAYGLSWQSSARQSVVTDAGCGYAVQPASIVFPPAGGSATVSVTAGENCPWTTATSDGWLTITPSTGTRGAIVAVTAERYAGLSRSGSVTVAGQDIPVTQHGLPPRLYYLAEGSTRNFFTLDVAIANPHDARADLRVRFLRPDGDPVDRLYAVAPKARLTIHVNDIPELQSADVSTVVESLSGLPLAVERTMAWDGTRYGGHGGTAVEAPSTRWFFAEGAQGYFDTYLLLANPGVADATVKVSYLREGAPPVAREYSVRAGNRFTVFAGDDSALIDRAFSMAIESDHPIVAERAMYWSRDGVFWTGGHESAGVPAPATSWFLAEGATGRFFDDYVMIGNPNGVAAQVTIDWLLSSGEVIHSVKSVPANARLTIEVEREHPTLADAAMSATLVSTQPIVVERSMYWPGTAAEWTEAHNSFGLTALSSKWAVADGRVGTSRGYETYVLVANPGTAPVTLRATFLRESGAPIVKTFVIDPQSRYNVRVLPSEGNQVRELVDEQFGALIEVMQGGPVAVERAMYWNSGGVTWAAGTSTVATPLP